MPGFIFAPWTVAMKLPMLNLWLIPFLALVLFCMSQMSIHMMAMLDLGDTLMMHGLEVRTMSLNKWLFFKTFSISSDEIWLFVFSLMYGIPMILRYNFNCSNLGEEIFSTSEGSEFLTYFSISCRSDPEEILLVVIIIPLLSTWMKSAIVLDLIVLRVQLILAMVRTWVLDKFLCNIVVY